MSNLLNNIRKIHQEEKSDHLVLSISTDGSGNPSAIFTGLEGGIFTRLGMIDMAIRQLEEVRADLYEKSDNQVTDVVKNSVPQELPHEKRLEELLEKLPADKQPHMRELISKMVDHIKIPENVDMKNQIVEDVMKQINKRCGFEGNSMSVEDFN